MDIRKLKERAQESLEVASYDPRKLFFLYTAISLAVTVMVAIADMLLQNAISGTGGLAGMQTRAVLTTVQSALQLASMLFLPFWQMGAIAVAIGLLRKEEVGPGRFWDGFRRFGPALRLMFLRFAIIMAVCVAVGYASAMIFALTPLSNGLQNLLAPMLESGDTAQLEAMLMDTDQLMTLLPYMAGAFVVFFALLCLVGIPLAYRMRMADFLVMDRRQDRAMGAVRESFRMMKRKGWALFRLDLSFWWFYLLDGLIVGVLYLDGMVTLPMSAEAAYWLCYGMYGLLQLVLYALALPRVQTTYAAAYQALLPEE